jgi:hypothetical protein
MAHLHETSCSSWSRLFDPRKMNFADAGSCTSVACAARLPEHAAWPGSSAHRILDNTTLHNALNLAPLRVSPRYPALACKM